ncbi:MAG: hypothetical protein MUF87_08430 [Anaerolineae bacterium]|jgi:hypothetical protein|nr:hypothetical protein [Anaerolineae bacterium]
MEKQVHFLKLIAQRCGLAPLKEVALQPGMKSVYRFTVHYDQLRASDCIATLKQPNRGAILLEVVYQGRFDHKPLTRVIDLTQYELFVTTLQKLSFDKLPDQDNVPFYGTDWWLIERAAGSFLKNVLLAPATAQGHHATLVQAIRFYFPEVIREMV